MMDIDMALSIARAWEIDHDSDEDEVLVILADAVVDLRKAARLIHDRRKMVSGSLEMGDCDEFCKGLGIDVWTWPL